ncbi:MAG: hypothetical protein KAX16_05490, partial [Actinomycetia bacterium]|nr:hypothetical protein [Actinomycetes bacterium]
MSLASFAKYSTVQLAEAESQYRPFESLSDTPTELIPSGSEAIPVTLNTPFELTFSMKVLIFVSGG